MSYFEHVNLDDMNVYSEEWFLAKEFVNSYILRKSIDVVNGLEMTQECVVEAKQ